MISGFRPRAIVGRWAGAGRAIVRGNDLRGNLMLAAESGRDYGGWSMGVKGLNK